MRERTSYRVQRSPSRIQNVGLELDEHTNRIKQLLRADLIMLEQENAILKAKCKKVGEQQEKIEMILKQNSQLLSENERLSKLLHQKKQEYEILKDKFEVQSTQKLEYATEFEYQRKRLLNELDQLEGELKEVEHIKNQQINELKSQYQIQLQALKRQGTSSQDIYEQEIRKLREQLDKKQYQLSDSLNRLKRFSSQAEYDVLRLKQEKEKLRSELLYLQAQKRKELDSIRSKLETNYLQEIESIKKNHLSSLQGFQLQNQKLKDLLQAKNMQIQQVNSKINKQKNNYEDALAMTKKENEMLRSKLVEYQRLSQSEKDSLKVKMNRVHESQIEEMRINHQKYIDCLQNQIAKLDATLRNKNAEIEQLIKEKANVRQIFDSEGNRLKEEIESLQIKLRDNQNRINEAIHSYEEKLKEKAKHIDYLDKLSQDQQQNFEKEVKTLKQIIEHQKSEFESAKMISRENEQQLHSTIQEQKSQIHTLRDAVSRERSEKDKQIQDLTYQLEGTITTLKTKADQLASRNSIVQRELESLKETIAFKQKEIKNLQERVRVSDEREKKLERQNDDLRGKLIKKDQKTNEMLAEQKQRLETTFAFTLDNLKIDHESALKLQANKQADLNQKIRRKQDELNSLLKDYKKMRDQMEGLTEQQANKKEMTLKFPGATADLIATKNLFDVYLKSRVLDLCGDVRDKENIKK